MAFTGGKSSLPFQSSPGRTRQKDIGLFIDDSFLFWMTGDVIRKGRAFRELERGFRRAMVVGVNAVRKQISTMRAVQYGFMRSTVSASIVADGNANAKTMIEGFIGTKAWYDILVHEGLGRHGGSRKLPSQYQPTDAQRAIVEPNEEDRLKDRGNWKRSPQRPRPFLTLGVKKAKKPMSAEIRKGFKSMMKQLKGRGGVPKHDITKIFFGGATSG